MYYTIGGRLMANGGITLQVRIDKNLSKLIDLSVKKRIYPTRSALVKDAIMKMFAPELRDDVLAEIMSRSRRSDYVPLEKVMKEYGLE
ncbi:MAG: ribbon-helix-helix domain-containing protein [Candidatus Micrarchaeota archaeon]